MNVDIGSALYSKAYQSFSVSSYATIISDCITLNNLSMYIMC